LQNSVWLVLDPEDKILSEKWKSSYNEIKNLMASPNEKSSPSILSGEASVEALVFDYFTRSFPAFKKEWEGLNIEVQKDRIRGLTEILKDLKPKANQEKVEEKQEEESKLENYMLMNKKDYEDRKSFKKTVKKKKSSEPRMDVSKMFQNFKTYLVTTGLQTIKVSISFMANN